MHQVKPETITHLALFIAWVCRILGVHRQVGAILGPARQEGGFVAAQAFIAATRPHRVGISAQASDQWCEDLQDYGPMSIRTIADNTEGLLEYDGTAEGGYQAIAGWFREQADRIDAFK